MQAENVAVIRDEIASHAGRFVVRYAYGDDEGVGVVQVTLTPVGLGLLLVGALSSRFRIDSQLGPLPESR